MRFKDCLWKNTLGEISLYHTRSAYQVIVDRDTLDVLLDMCVRNEAELTQRQREYYQKLAAQKMMEPGEGKAPEERSRSPLVHLELEISAECNLACKHCFADNAGGLMDFDFFNGVLDEALKLGAIAVSLNGGEALLHPRVVEMIRQSRQRDFRTDIFTNGTLITPQFCKNTARLGLDKVYVSLDGFQEQHEMVRGKGTFERTVRGIKLLREHGIRVWINSLIHRQNEAELPAFRKFCLDELGVNGMRFSSVHPIGRAKQNMSLFEFPEKTRGALADLPDGHERSGKRGHTLPCKAGVRSLYVTQNGNLYPCYYFQQAAVVLGDLHQKSLGDIYLAHLEQKNIFTDFDYDRLTECRDCPAFSTCDGGCRGRALVFKQDLYGKDPISCAKRGLPE